MKLTNPNAKPIEVVLDDGRFASIKRPTRGDLVEMVVRAAGDMNMLIPHLVAMLVQIDGEPISVQEWLDSDFEASAPIANALDAILKSAGNNRGVA